MQGRHRSGITLIQGLVVIVVLFFLLLLLYYHALFSRRKLASSVKCQANMTLIAKNTLAYSADDPMANTLPVAPSFTNELGGAFEYGGRTGLEDYPYSQAVKSKWGSGANRGLNDRPLNPYIYKDLPRITQPDTSPAKAAMKDANADMFEFCCPKDFGDTTSGWNDSPPGFKASRTMGTDRFRNSGRSAYEYYGTSYAANTLWCYYEKDGTPVALPGNGESPIFSISPFLHAVDDLRNPAGTISYIEANGRYAARWAGNHASNPCPTSYYGTKGVTKSWHKGDWRFIAAFADGHASVVEMDGSLDPSTITTPFTPATTNGISTDVQDWRCMLFRGNGWQLDILPSAPAMTPHTTADSSKNQQP